MTGIPAPLRRLVVAFALQASVFAAPSKPNVILIVTDDQGYADVGCYGGEGVETPNLDRLAAEGARFTDFYAANSVCSPSRASILTGRYSTRCGVPEVLGPDAWRYLEGYHVGLPPSEVTLAELLKRDGYTTACIGKWHLGHEERHLPTNQGFDGFFGLPYSNDMPIDPLHAKLAEDIKLNGGATRESIRAGDHAKEKTCPSGQPTDNPGEFHTPLMIGDEVVEFPVDQATLTERYTDEAIAFMDRCAGKPFLLYLAHTMPHVPLAATEAFRSGKPRASYADTIKELDHNIGRLLAHLDKTGTAANTLVLFTSDNGPLGQSPGFGGSARPLKGFKFQTHEGGQRVPFIVRWPDVVPAGEVIPEVVSALDILPTVADAAGVAPPKDIDGTSLLPLLRGDETAGFGERPFFYIRGLEIQAVRLGDWKLQLAAEGHPYRMKIPEPPEPRLHNLREDPSESRDLAADHPDIVAKLLRLVENADAELGSGATNHRAEKGDTGANHSTQVKKIEVFYRGKHVRRHPGLLDSTPRLLAVGACVHDVTQDGR